MVLLINIQAFFQTIFPFGSDENRLSALPVETPCSWQQSLSGLVVSLEKVQVRRQSQGSIPGADQVWEEGNHCFKKMLLL